MQWYDYLIILFGIIGIMLALLGSYHEHGIRKTGVIGWIILIFLLIIRVCIWLAFSMF